MTGANGGASELTKAYRRSAIFMVIAGLGVVLPVAHRLLWGDASWHVPVMAASAPVALLGYAMLRRALGRHR